MTTQHGQYADVTQLVCDRCGPQAEGRIEGIAVDDRLSRLWFRASYEQGEWSVRVEDGSAEAFSGYNEAKALRLLREHLESEGAFDLHCLECGYVMKDLDLLTRAKQTTFPSLGALSSKHPEIGRQLAVIAGRMGHTLASAALERAKTVGDRQVAVRLCFPGGDWLESTYQQTHEGEYRCAWYRGTGVEESYLYFFGGRDEFAFWGEPF